jgi:putative ABC transport system ATP-binding protein
MKNLIELKKLTKTYGANSTKFNALSYIDLTIKEGEFIAIMGPSGCGKSTLLHILGCLDKPTSGSYFLENEEVSRHVSTAKLAYIRRKKIGFIFQSFNLLARVSALNNVILPAIYSGLKNRKNKAANLLKDIGLGKRINHQPNQLSGGEQQRVAIARALMNDPKIILADEPTGNLDSKSGKEIMKLLKQLNHEGKTIIIVTHDREIAQQTDRIIKMQDGKII